LRIPTRALYLEIAALTEAVKSPPHLLKAKINRWVSGFAIGVSWLVRLLPPEYPSIGNFGGQQPASAKLTLMGNPETDRFILALSRCGGLFTASVRAAISPVEFLDVGVEFLQEKGLSG
jgi:hypothetical protein